MESGREMTGRVVFVRAPYMEMRVEKATVHIIQPVGDVDMRNVHRIRRAISDGVNEGRRRVILDLTRLESIDLFSLGAIAATKVMLVNLEGDLRVSAPRPEIWQIFKRAGLDNIFEPYASQEDAIESFKDEWEGETTLTPQ